jgi:hypothetical protein
VTASRKKWPDSVIWLVSEPTKPNFDRPYLHPHQAVSNNETGYEHRDPNLRLTVGLTLETEKKIFAGIHAVGFSNRTGFDTISSIPDPTMSVN